MLDCWRKNDGGGVLFKIFSFLPPFALFDQRITDRREKSPSQSFWGGVESV